jgi:hypothetical protein
MVVCVLAGPAAAITLLLFSHPAYGPWAVRLAGFAIAVLAAACLWRSLRRADAGWLPAAGLLLILAGGAIADQRPPWTRYVDASGPDAGLSSFLAGASRIWWQGDSGAEILWFRARRPSYFSCVQGAESIFFRDVAVNWVRRGVALRELPGPGDRAAIAACGPKDPWPGSAADLGQACRALPDLDAIVLGRAIPGVAGRTWIARPTEGSLAGLPLRDWSFWRYDCKAFR